MVAGAVLVCGLLVTFALTTVGSLHIRRLGVTEPAGLLPQVRSQSVSDGSLGQFVLKESTGARFVAIL